ncbi:DNA-directed RNA polymerase subunit omega [Campylobacter jejuni subsp. jejuni M1]|nr:DNA-directed RNA polymerase subunit omega [Campylobacter jejuni subsp. jejuni M1]
MWFVICLKRVIYLKSYKVILAFVQSLKIIKEKIMDKRIEEVAAKALEKMGNDRYRLSLVVAKRAEQLANGATPLVDFDKNKNKLADIALYEIAENKITLEGLVETNR